MDPRVVDAWMRLPDYFGNHVLVSMTALALGIGLSLPLAFVAARRPLLRGSLLAVTSIVQTVPGLALLALFYPLLLGAAALSARLFGASFSALGFLPSVLALTLYSMLPILRNTIAGLQSIDPAIEEAALGVGMTPRQSLFMVQWPLALPVIMAGIRTSAVWVIGTATLATPIGQTSLGNYIFTGLQTQNWIFVLFGCVCAAVLAVAVDQLLALAQAGMTERRPAKLTAGMLGIVIIAALALVPTLSRGKQGYMIGAKPFAEQYILASLLAQRLRASGLAASERTGLGSAVAFDALKAGEIDVYVEYSGTIWANQMQRTDTKPRDAVIAEIARWLIEQHGIVLVGGLGFENAYALAMARNRAATLGINSLADLARHRNLTVAGDYEFFGRPEWRALNEAYGLSFASQRQMQPEFMYPAVAAGDVDVISAYTSDGRVAQFDLKILDDPKRAIPPYDAILLVSPARANDAALDAALRPLIGAIDVDIMREANRRAGSGDATASPEAVARWLSGQIKGP